MVNLRQLAKAVVRGIFLGKIVFVRKHPPLQKTAAFFDKSECLSLSEGHEFALMQR